MLVGYRWWDAKKIAPAYPFGYGQSYTTFKLSKLHIDAGGDTVVAADVTNTGARSGSAVPQLYLGLPAPDASTVQPPRQLRGFDKVALAPGQTKRVRFTLDERAFSYWSTAANDWRIAPGCYSVEVGTSSRNLPLRSAIARGGAACKGAVTVRNCTSRRAFGVHFAKRVARRARVTVSGGGKASKPRRSRGRYVTKLDLRGARKGIITLRASGRSRSGKRATDTRRYRTCTPKPAAGKR